MRRFLVPATAVCAAVLTVVAIGVTTTQAQAAEPLPVAAVTASDDDGNVPENTLDDDLSTRWSAEGDGVWIRYDLGEATTVGWLAIAWHQGDRRTATFEVQTSTDGDSWHTAIATRGTSGTTLQPESYDFPDVSARYLRIVGYGNTVNDWTSITEVDIYGAGSPDDGGGGGDCDYPAQVLDLANWKITLPIDDPDRSGTQPLEVKQPALATYAHPEWFRPTADCDGVQFRAPVDGVTTSGSSYPRSELREMTDNGTRNASWSSTSGTHTLVVEEAFTALPADKPHVVGAQIHDSDDDVTVFRLEGSKLYITNGDTTHHKLVTDNYVLGTRFEAKFVVRNGRIEVYYNGTLQTTITKSFSGGYFKAGAYTQANCDKSSPCRSDNDGQVVIYRLSVSHS